MSATTEHPSDAPAPVVPLSPDWLATILAAALAALAAAGVLPHVVW